MVSRPRDRSGPLTRHNATWACAVVLALSRRAASSPERSGRSTTTTGPRSSRSATRRSTRGTPSWPAPTSSGSRPTTTSPTWTLALWTQPLPYSRRDTEIPLLPWAGAWKPPFSADGRKLLCAGAWRWEMYPPVALAPVIFPLDKQLRPTGECWMLAHGGEGCQPEWSPSRSATAGRGSDAAAAPEPVTPRSHQGGYRMRRVALLLLLLAALTAAAARAAETRLAIVDKGTYWRFNAACCAVLAKTISILKQNNMNLLHSPLRGGILGAREQHGLRSPCSFCPWRPEPYRGGASCPLAGATPGASEPWHAQPTVWIPVAERASGPPRSPETQIEGRQPLPFRCRLPCRPEGSWLALSRGSLPARPGGWQSRKDMG